jgi:predicted PurR-regulated permease PerM
VYRSVAALGILALFFIGLAGMMAVAIPVVGSERATLIDKFPE